jgi:hypothetical protein
MTPEECMQIYGDAWFERDPVRRVEMLRRCCAEDVLFVDSTLGRLHGLEAVSDMIGCYRSVMGGGAGGSAPTEVTGRGRSQGGVSADVVTQVEQLHGFLRFSFVWRLPDGSKLAGTDVCEVADDGRMKLITVWSASAEFPVPGM